jgi:chromosome segregation protein
VILEKSGKFVKGKYSLTGGSVGLFEGKKIGRAKNLEKLSIEISAQSKIVNDLKLTIQEKHNEVIVYNTQLKENAIKQTEQEINALINQLFGLQNKIENLNHQNGLSESKLNDFSTQLNLNQEAIAQTRIELNELNNQLIDIQQKIILIEDDYTAAESEYNSVSTLLNESNLNLAKQQSKLSAIKQEFDFKTNQLNDLITQVESSKTQLEEAVVNIESTAESLKEIEFNLIEQLKNKEAEEKALNEADQSYYNLRNILTEKESALRLKQKSKEGIDTLLNEIKDRLTDLKLQLAGMKERLNVEFKVDLDAIIDEPRTGEVPLEELQEKNEKLRKRLENIGEVNPTAIEAYTEMKKI